MPARALVLLLIAGVLASCAAGTEPPSIKSTAPSVASLQVPSAGELLIDTLIRSMSTPELAGQMLMVSIEQGENGPVTRLEESERAFLRRIEPGGVILFSVNLQSVPQVHNLVLDLQESASLPLMIATDHEGGLVSRLTASDALGATVMPSATLVGTAAEALRAEGDTAGIAPLAEQWGLITGRELRALGITLNLGPVADIDPPDGPGFLGTQRRTFGSDPELVAELVAATITGLHGAGVAAAVKHFPGHGSAREDSHESIVALTETETSLHAANLVPFVAAIESGVDAVMSAHAAFPTVTHDMRPATLSPRLLTDLLRNELGFTGVVMTDALNMEAVAALDSPATLALAAIEAGADVLLQPQDPEAVHTAIVNAVDSGRITRERLERSIRRILALKRSVGLLGPGVSWVNPNADTVLGSEEHRDYLVEVRRIARGEGRQQQ